MCTFIFMHCLVFGGGWDFHSLNLRVFSLKFLESIAQIARPMDLKLRVDPDGF
jgi:hypothetical protein